MRPGCYTLSLSLSLSLSLYIYILPLLLLFSLYMLSPSIAQPYIHCFVIAKQVKGQWSRVTFNSAKKGESCLGQTHTRI
jgi:hypothetical protein